MGGAEGRGRGAATSLSGKVCKVCLQTAEFAPSSVNAASCRLGVLHEKPNACPPSPLRLKEGKSLVSPKNPNPQAPRRVHRSSPHRTCHSGAPQSFVSLQCRQKLLMRILEGGKERWFRKVGWGLWDFAYLLIVYTFGDTVFWARGCLPN